MQLHHYVNTLGQQLQRQYGQKIHKLTINAQFTCPNRDGSKGIGGCTFCNNASFSPNARETSSVSQQLQSGRITIAQRTGAKKYLGYFQAYTNTYAEVSVLRQLYQQALQQQDVVGLSVGTRPDCVPDATLDLLAEYQSQGHEIWLELGLQSAFDQSLQRVNRGHGFAEYQDAVRRARQRQLKICTHLIIGLPGETAQQSLTSLQRVLDVGTQGLKLHPLHVVRGSLLANQWRQGDYQPLQQQDYIDVASEMIRHTPKEVIYHRITATAGPKLLLAPEWCGQKWPVMNAITANLAQHGAQGHALNQPVMQQEVLCN